MKKANYNDTLVFLFLTFCIPIIYLVQIMGVNSHRSETSSFILYGIAAASPTLATLITVCIFKKDFNIKDFLIQKYINKFSLKYCIIAFFTPAIIFTLSKIIINIITQNSVFFTFLSGKKLFILLWALIAEELGWRGFLQDKVEKTFGKILTPLIVGIVWASWHYHSFVADTMGVPFIIFLYGCIAESFGYYVITKLSKNNILPASIWHFSGNLFYNLYLINPSFNNGSLLPYLISIGLHTIYIVVFLIYHRVMGVH